MKKLGIILLFMGIVAVAIIPSSIILLLWCKYIMGLDIGFIQIHSGIFIYKMFLMDWSEKAKSDFKEMLK